MVDLLGFVWMHLVFEHRASSMACYRLGFIWSRQGCERTSMCG